MTTTALIYHDSRDHSTCYLGSVSGSPGISVSELMYKLGYDKELLCKTFDLPAFPDKSLYTVDSEDDPFCTLEPMDAIQDECLVFETPAGIRQIAIPNIGDTQAALRMCNYDLYENLRFKDIICVKQTNPGYPEFRYGDYYKNVYAVRIDSDMKFEAYNKFDSFQRAKEVAERLHNTRPNHICNSDDHISIVYYRLYAGCVDKAKIIWRDGVFLDA